MSFTIDLPPELEKALQRHAAQRGQDVTAFVLQAVRGKIDKARTFDEICAPFSQAVHETGITDEEFDHFFGQVREEVWEEKQGRHVNDEFGRSSTCISPDRGARK